MPSAGESRSRLLLAYTVCFVTWGSSWSVVKLAIDDLPPLLFAGMRMLLAGVALLPFARLHRAGLGLKQLGLIAAVGLLQICFSYGLLFIAQQWIPSSWSALLFSTFPVWLLLVGRVLLPDQRLTPLKVLSTVLGLCGIVVLQYDSLHGLSVSGLVIAGCMLTVLGALFTATANVIVRWRFSHIAPHVSVCVQTLCSSVLLLLASAALESGQPVHWTPRAIGAVVYLAIGATVVTYQLLYWLLPRMPLAAIGAMPLLDTLVAVLLGVALLHEPVTLPLVLSGVLILGSAALANLSPSSDATSGGTPARTVAS